MGIKTENLKGMQRWKNFQCLKNFNWTYLEYGNISKKKLITNYKQQIKNSTYVHSI